MARLSDRVVTGAPNGILSNDEPIQWYAADGITLIDGIKVDATGAVYLAPAGGPTEVGGTLAVTGNITGPNSIYMSSDTSEVIRVTRTGTNAASAELSTSAGYGSVVLTDAAGTAQKIKAFGSEMRFDQGGTTRMTIDSNGDLNVTGSYRQTTAPATYAHPSADDLIIGTTAAGNSGMTIVSGTSGFGNVFFSDGTVAADQYSGYLQYVHSTDKLSFGVGGAPAMDLTSAGLAVTGNLATGGDVTIENSTPILDITYTGSSGRIDFNDSVDAVKARIIYTEGTGLRIGSNGTTEAITIPDATNNVNVSGGVRVSGDQSTPLTNEGLYGGHPSRGAHIQGHGSANDVTVSNQSGAVALAVPQGTINVEARGDLDVTGRTTGTGGFDLPNNIPVRGVPTTGGTVRMLRLNTSNQVEVGSTNSTLVFTATQAVKKTGTGTDVSLTRGNGTSGAINIYRNNGNTPWSIVGGQAGVTLDLELDYNGSLRGDFNSTTGAYTALSLRKFKDNIEDVVDPYETIRRLRPRTYTMSGVETAGYIYDEVDGVLDIASMDTGINHRPVGVNHDVINTYTTAAVQRLIVASEAAATEITQLKAEIQELRGLIK